MSATKEKLVGLDKKKKTNTRRPRTSRTARSAKMKEAADKAAGRGCKPLIQALSVNECDSTSVNAKFLYELACFAEESGEAQKAEKFRRMALELANSPEWKGEPQEDDDDLTGN